MLQLTAEPTAASKAADISSVLGDFYMCALCVYVWQQVYILKTFLMTFSRHCSQHWNRGPRGHSPLGSGPWYQILSPFLHVARVKQNTWPCFVGLLIVQKCDTNHVPWATAYTLQQLGP